MRSTGRKGAAWFADEKGIYGENYWKFVGPAAFEKTDDEIKFLKKELALKPGGKILDVACGHGRHSIGLARLGYKVTGLDLSSYFLGIAKEHAQNEDVQINWVKSDMRGIKFKGKFDAAINMFTAFGHFESDEESADVIKRIARALKPRGKFIMDFVNRDYIIRNYVAKSRQKLDDGSEKIVERKFDHLWGGHDEHVVLCGKGKKQEFTIRFRFYSLTELTAMMRNAGMRILKVYGDFDFRKLDFDSRRCIIVAEKMF